MADDKYKYLDQLALEEVRHQCRLIIEAADALTGKATSLLSSSGLILTLFSIFQITLLREAQQPQLYCVGLVTVVVFLVAMLVLLLYALWPRGYRSAMDATWEDLAKVIRAQDTLEDARAQLMAEYLGCMTGNRAINESRAVAIRAAEVLFGILVVLIVFLSLFVAR